MSPLGIRHLDLACCKALATFRKTEPSSRIPAWTPFLGSEGQQCLYMNCGGGRTVSGELCVDDGMPELFLATETQTYEERGSLVVDGSVMAAVCTREATYVLVASPQGFLSKWNAVTREQVWQRDVGQPIGCLLQPREDMVVCVTIGSIVALSAQSGLILFENDEVLLPASRTGEYRGTAIKAAECSEDMLFLGFFQLFHERERDDDGQEIDGYGEDVDLSFVVGISLQAGNQVWREMITTVGGMYLRYSAETGNVSMGGSDDICFEPRGVHMVWNALTGQNVYRRELEGRVVHIAVSGSLTALVIDTQRDDEIDQLEGEVHDIRVLNMGGGELFHVTSDGYVTGLSLLHGRLLSWATHKGEVNLVDISSGKTLSRVDMGHEGFWSIYLQESALD